MIASCSPAELPTASARITAYARQYRSTWGSIVSRKAVSRGFEPAPVVNR